MTIGRTRLSIIVAGMLAFTLNASSAHALLSGAQFKCFQTIAKGTLGFVKGRLKVLQKCRNANLKSLNNCTPPDGVGGAALAKLDTKLDATIDAGCPLLAGDYANMGFPGQCSDANVNDGFTTADLKACLKTSHDALIDQMLDLQYDATLVGTLTGTALKCQTEIAKNAAAVVTSTMKAVQKCRNSLLDCKVDPNTLLISCKLSGFSADNCATSDSKTSAAINKAKTKANTAIAAKCATDAGTVKACEPDQNTGAAAATCEVDGHVSLTDNPSTSAPPDLIDYEYARPGICGDNVVNSLDEECDGTDDSACPGQCGSAQVPNGFFACLCKDKPRVYIREHSNADTDNGWNGLSTDGAVVEGSGYLVDYSECDGGGNCLVGPTCSLAPHSSCAVASNAPLGTTSNSICAGLGQGTCRKERTATGPHCYLDIQKRCSENGDLTTCTAPGDFCETTFHSPPVAQAAGGVAVCNVSRFSEDIIGTININTGAGSMKVRQRAVTYSPITQDKPCPVCGGFCAVSRDRCTVDGDCGANGPCVTDAICSDGVRQNKPCRRGEPYGGVLPFFGTTSVDCLPNTALLTANGGGLDINPIRTTGTATLLPSFNCTGAGFSGKTCLGGTSEGRPCTLPSECPGGTCTGQCFCSGQTQPNACNAACVGGTSDGASCLDDTDCPPDGFCHPGDCRVDPFDTTSTSEGICTSGPQIGHCSTTTYRGCAGDGDCTPPTCPVCQGGETCIFKNLACFVSNGIVRTGAPGNPERTTAGVYCVPANGPAINASAGFPGPGALIQHETLVFP